MWILLKLKKLFSRYLSELNGFVIFILLASYFAFNWLLLYLVDEHALLELNNFIYWLVVTSSTVGYGDLSPVTESGKMIVAFITIPFGLSLFALIIGRIAMFSAAQWTKGIKGLKRLNTQDHIIVIGWNEKRTQHLLKLLITETQHSLQRNIVLCTTEDIDNPEPEHIQFVKVSRFNDADEMQRACLDKASSIIIDTKLDDVTLTTALFCSLVNPSAHLIVYFADESLSKLLKKHCPKAECTPSLSTEILVKAAMDPGSSVLHHELLNAAYGVTQYSVEYPTSMPKIDMESLFYQFKQRYNATVIAILPGPSSEIVINPNLEMEIDSGMTIYYIAKQRILNLEWQKLNV